MREHAERWLRSLPTELAPHRELMLGLMREAERDPGIRLLVVGCSIGRGNADELSDVDAMYAVTEPLARRDRRKRGGGAPREAT